MPTVYNQLLNTTEEQAVQEIIEQDVLPAVLYDRELDGHAVDMKVYGNGRMEFDPDGMLDPHEFDIDRWNVEEHTQGTLVLTVRASTFGIIPSSQSDDVAYVVQGIAKLSLSLSQNAVSGQSKVILAPV